jgi:hypothetical protein
MAAHRIKISGRGGRTRQKSVAVVWSAVARHRFLECGNTLPLFPKRDMSRNGKAQSCLRTPKYPVAV